MSPSPPPPEDEDPDALAAEFVLRLLDPEETEACARRVARDPAFAAAVARWEAELQALDAAFLPVDPPRRLRAAVETRLFGAPQPTGLARLWASAGIWRGLAAAAAVAAIALALLPRTEPAAPGLVATVATTASAIQLTAVYDGSAGQIRFSRIAGSAAPGRSLELWLLPQGATAPTSLGVIPAAAEFAVAVPASLAGQVKPGALIIVSDEVAGGSPTGQPQGPALAQGAIRAL